MRKIVVVEVAIVSAILIAVLLLMFMWNGVTVAEQNQVVNLTGSIKHIIFDLKAGQHVSGAMNYSGDELWFAIYDPTGEHITNADNYQGNHTGTFSFTASMDGEYWLNIHKRYFGAEYLDYQYTVSPAFLGLDKTELILIVVAVGGLSAAITTLNYRWKPKKV